MSEENPYTAPESDVHAEQQGERELAGRWLRLGGAIIDGLIVGLVFWAIAYSFIWEQASTATLSLTESLLVGLGGCLVFLLINGYLLHTSGQTIAKRLLGMQIVSVHNGKILPLGRLLGLRYLPVYLANSVTLVGPLFGLVNALFIFGSEKRCVHDYIAGTRVVLT